MKSLSYEKRQKKIKGNVGPYEMFSRLDLLPLGVWLLGGEK